MTVVEAPVRAEPWVAVRLVLAVLYVLVLGAAAAGHVTEATLQDLYADVADGAVTRVELEGGLPQGSTGYAAQTATWSTGARRWSVDLVVHRPLGTDTRGSVAGERTTDDVGAEVRRRDSDVQVVAADYRSGLTREVYGTRLPMPLYALALAGLLGGIVLLAGGPEPYRATRWSWFWLSYVPGGALAFLALSGPTPGLRSPPPDERRLTGGAAFLLALLLGAVTSGAVALLVQALWPPHG